MTTATLPAVSPVRRLLPWVATEKWRLALAIFLGSMAIGCGVGLLATSAWLISRASLQPPIFELDVAIVGVRAFGIGKGVFRYAERLTSHDAAFRALSKLRLAVYDRLAVVAPAGVPAYRRGDLLERLVRDVDATQDLPLRVIVPYASGALVALASVVLAFFILPAAGVVLLVSLLLAATVVPWITARAAADAERATAPERGRLNGDVLTLLDAVDPVPDPVAPVSAPSGVVGVTIRGLRASWPGGSAVLEGLDLEVPAGGRVGIVGPSGVGKSTLLAVLASFLPYEGSVRLGDVELHAMAGHDARGVVGWCPQLPHVFDTSVVENVRLARPDATDEDVRAVLDAVGLGPWLEAQPLGLDSPVGDHGALVSAGQRQRLGVARVLLGGHPVVLLDEPTEHLDEATADVVADELLRALEGRTVLWVAHRPHGLESLDRIVTLG